MEVPVGQKKELSIPPIWDCCGPTRVSFFTYRQIKHPPFSEIAVKTHSQFGPYLVDYFKNSRAYLLLFLVNTPKIYDRADPVWHLWVPRDPWKAKVYLLVVPN